MKVLLMGPYPPPSGGISVHVYEAARQLRSAGIVCRVLNLERRAPESSEYLTVRSAAGLARLLFRHATGGWTLHLHAHGHSDRIWMLAVFCGLAGWPAPARLLTVHSGMATGYLRRGGRLRRLLVRIACALHTRVVAVSSAVRDALLEAGVPGNRLDVQPAFLMPAPAATTPAANSVTAKLEGRSPVLAVTLFFRPEYGFDLLLDAIGRLRERHPRLVCVVLGSGDQQAEAEQAAGAAGLSDYLVFAGNLPHGDCLALMARADVFLRPTRADGDSNSVREALTLGVRTVASDVTARPAGTILFRTGDSLSLAEAIERALVMPPPQCERTAGDDQCEPGWSAEPLLNIYRNLPASAAGPNDVSRSPARSGAGNQACGLARPEQSGGLVTGLGGYHPRRGRTQWES